MMKKLLIILLTLALLMGTAGGEKAEEHPENEGAAAPAVIDRTADPAAFSDFAFPAEAKILHIWFPNIMNADEAILLYDGCVWLIDCGDERMGARGAELIRKLEIPRIDKILNSHPHHDHLNGLRATDKAAKVEELALCFTEGDIRPASSRKHLRNALAYAEKNGITVSSFAEGDVLAMGDGGVTLTCYINPDPKLDLNNRSAQMMLRCGERTILFTADMEKPGQEAMLARLPEESFKADILKYPHHGKSAMDDAFLEAVDPEIAVITNQKVEKWKGIMYLKKLKIPYVYTNVYHHINNKTKKPLYLHLMTDGKHWVMERAELD